MKTKQQVYEDATLKELGNNPIGTRMDVVYLAMDLWQKELLKEERILCSALNFNGIIICGHKHSDCYAIYKKITGNECPAEREHQGFLTSHNRYVDRKEAFHIAVKMKQILYGEESTVESLISENLY